MTAVLGFREEELDSVEREATTAELSIAYKIGLLKFDLSHWMQREETATESIDNQRTVLRVERDFW